MSDYQTPAYTTEQPKKKGKGCLIAAIVVGLLGLVMFGGCAGLAYFGLNKVGEQVTTALAADPNVTSIVGEVQEAKMDMAATGQANQGVAGGDILVYRVTGSKGSGKAQIRMNQQTGTVEMLGFEPDK